MTSSESRKSVSFRGKSLLNIEENIEGSRDSLCNESNYHDFLQQQTYVEELYGNEFEIPSPPVRISEPFSTPQGPHPYTQSQSNTSQSQNMSNFGDDDAKNYKSKLFRAHIKNVEKEPGQWVVRCNYYSKELKWNKSGGYSSYWKHINTNHLAEATRPREQQ
ncbi:hypothetical protein ACOSP7_004571 [Xanthoceras sorbifolium]